MRLNPLYVTEMMGYPVLILVVMEYTQWEIMEIRNAEIMSVLILVVMEYTQWGDAVAVASVGMS